MQTVEHTFNFGAFGRAPVTIFHPALSDLRAESHLLFVPPDSSHSIEGFGGWLFDLAVKEQSLLYALRFGTVGDKGQLKQSERRLLVTGAVLFLRPGVKRLIVVTCSAEMTAHVFGCGYFRIGRDKLQPFCPI